MTLLHLEQVMDASSLQTPHPPVVIMMVLATVFASLLSSCEWALGALLKPSK